MGSIGRYIFRATLGAFLVVLVSVSALMWMTQALRNFDLMTNQGQSVFVFVGITALIIPMLMMIIAPIALLIAIAHVLNKLSNDSELIVMNAAGMAPWQVFRPFLYLGILVSLFVAWLSFYLSPMCLQEMRRWATHVRAEIVTNNVQPGRFIVVDGKLTLHIRTRDAKGQLHGILVDDQRNPKERATVIAERGDFVTNDRGIFLLLANGAVHQYETGKSDPVIVRFEDYAFDLSRLSPGGGSVTYAIHELSIEELLKPRPDTPENARYNASLRAELHDRITAPFYPLAFLMVAFAFLGAPRTTRQSRAMSLVLAVVCVAIVRWTGFVGTIAGTRVPITLAVPYLGIAVALGLSAWAIGRGLVIEPPAFVGRTIDALVEGIKRRMPAAAGQQP